MKISYGNLDLDIKIGSVWRVKDSHALNKSFLRLNLDHGKVVVKSIEKADGYSTQESLIFLDITFVNGEGAKTTWMVSSFLHFYEELE
jgi:hypothetical protein